jgi:Ni/Co efflux regulator RcnB
VDPRNYTEILETDMKKLLLTLTLCAALAPALSLAQDDSEAGQIQEVEAADQAQNKFAELQAKYQADMEKLRAEQEAKMAELRAEEQARIEKEQARLNEIRAERNEKIADLRSQLMTLQSEQSNEMSSAGVMNGYSTVPMQSYSAPMQSYVAPQISTPVAQAEPMADASVMETALTSPQMPAILMDIYGPPQVAPKRGCCLFGKCGR